MKALIYNSVSCQSQERLPLQPKTQNNQDVETVNENGFSFVVCHRCGWAGIASTPSKWIEYPKGELRERKRYPKSKCPTCD